jgi:uncharacterized SAM-binding protein YcdF (DUF218 family)
MRVDSVLSSLGWEALKPVLGALALPPVPWLVLMLFGVRAVARQNRLSGGLMTALALLGLWFSCTAVAGDVLQRLLLRPPRALAEARITELRQLPPARKIAVVVLGGGRESLAPEYGEAHLSSRSMERLHYGHWLSRRLGAPLMYTGGVGREETEGAPEAEIAARISERDFGRRLRWTERLSRDTRENAAASVPLLAADGVTDIVLVTHAWHMPRAERAFANVARRQSRPLQVVVAPMGLARHTERAAFRWLPSAEGIAHVRAVLREGIGLLMGA